MVPSETETGWKALSSGSFFFTHGPLDYSCAICGLTLLFCLPSIHNTDPSQLPAICFFSSFPPTGIKTKEAPFSPFQALISQSCRMRDQCAGRQMDAARGQEKELELRIRHKRGWGVLAYRTRKGKRWRGKKSENSGWKSLLSLSAKITEKGPFWRGLTADSLQKENAGLSVLNLNRLLHNTSLLS